MSRPFWLVSVIAATLAIAIACSKPASSPSAPSAASPAQVDETTDANADGTLLKASAPRLQSPINAQRLTTEQAVTLVISNSVATYVPTEVFSYRFEVLNAAGAVIYTSPNVAGGAGTTSHTVPVALPEDQTYQWQARAVSQGVTGSISSRASFVIEAPEGYARGNELYDPLFNGKTIGQGFDVAFVPGVGIRLLSQTSYVRYALPQTLTSGEISVLVTNITSGTSGTKTKVFSMSEGDDDMTTNRRRFTVEKRGGVDAGAVAFRVITSEDQIETVGDERVKLRFLFNNLYFWRAAFGGDGRNGSFNLTIDDGGVGGSRMYDYGKPYSGSYNPNPHVIFLGSPPNRSGPDSQTVPNMVIRQLWVSSRPRPNYANK
jgi:hypothetical protein